VKFEWDAAKSESNREKHGITLEAASALWAGAVLELESYYPQETRKLAIGKIGGRYWTIIFTLRGGKIRLISARRSRENEKALYHEKDHNQKP
jgi:uncharacterized protein